MGILLIIGFICLVYSLSSMSKGELVSLKKFFDEIAHSMAIVASIGMLGLCSLALWILIDEKSAITFIFAGAVTEPIFIREFEILKWVFFLPLPLLIPYIIYRLIHAFKPQQTKTTE